VTRPDRWPTATQMDGRRLILEPLRVHHAEEMAPRLNDAALHTFVGGEPATVDDLRRRYTMMCVGHSPDGTQGWLNWVVRRRDDGSAVGFVQATVTEQKGLLGAEVAWTIVTAHQHRGFAQEAAQPMVGWLREHGARPLLRNPSGSRRLSRGGRSDRADTHRRDPRRRGPLVKLSKPDLQPAVCGAQPPVHLRFTRSA
jgi:RimJ/RimL family protein N-acetyltransferase